METIGISKLELYCLKKILCKKSYSKNFENLEYIFLHSFPENNIRLHNNVNLNIIKFDVCHIFQL